MTHSIKRGKCDGRGWVFAPKTFEETLLAIAEIARGLGWVTSAQISRLLPDVQASTLTMRLTRMHEAGLVERRGDRHAYEWRLA